MTDRAENTMLPNGSGKPLLQPPATTDYRPMTEVSQETVGESIGLNHLMQVLWRGKARIVLLALLGLALSICVGLMMTPVYRARTAIQLEGFNSNYFLRDVTPVGTFVGNTETEAYLNNQIKILLSETVARRVAAKLPHEATEKHSGIFSRAGSTIMQYARNLGLPISPPLAPEEQRVRTVQKALNVEPSLRSSSIEIFYKASNADMAAQAANMVASEYIALNREARWNLAQSTTEWLRDQTAELKETLERTSERLQNYARSSGLVFTGAQSTVAEDSIRQIQDALAKAQADRAAKQSRYEAVTSTSVDLLPEAAGGQPLREYQVALGNARSQLADLRAQYTSAHAKVRRLEAQVSELEGQIARERQQIIDRLRTEYLAAVRYEHLMSVAYAEQIRTVQDQTDKSAHYNLVKRELDSTQQLYDSMLQRAKEAGAAAALRTTNVRLIDAARPPLAPYSPNYPLHGAIGLAMGGMFGVGMVILRELSDVIKRPGDAQLLNVLELGVIPSAPATRWLAGPKLGLVSLKTEEQALELVTWNQDRSLLSESYRATLASILFTAEPRPRVMVVTSVGAGEGKTTVATNLAIALRETKKRVLLIDADLRRPRMHTIFHIANDRGLTDLLRSAGPVDSVPLETLAHPTRIPDLWVLPPGSGPTAIPSLLYSTDLVRLLQRFRSEFDLVLIDTPPMMLYPDARVLGRVTDGVIIVVRAGQTSREQLRAAHQRFTQDMIPVIGTVLNDWRGDSAGQYGHYGKYYRDYQRTGQRDQSDDA